MPDCLTLYWDGKADKCDDSQCVCGTLNVKCNNGEQCVNGNCRGGNKSLISVITYYISIYKVIYIHISK